MLSRGEELPVRPPAKTGKERESVHGGRAGRTHHVCLAANVGAAARAVLPASERPSVTEQRRTAGGEAHAHAPDPIAAISDSVAAVSERLKAMATDLMADLAGIQHLD